jgi:cytochrome b
MKAESKKTLIWDLPVRVFHWLLVLSFFGAFVTAESERWRLLHVTLGYTVGGLVAFRVLWGLVGTRHARFASFVRGPVAVAHYLGLLLRGRPAHHAGHNPAGALAVVLLLALSALSVLTGWLTYEDMGGHWLEELHEGAGNFMLLVVGVHVIGVVVASWLHRENLVRAMVTGQKRGESGDGIRWSVWPLGVLLLAAVLAFWWWQWDNAPQVNPAAASVSADHRGHDDDD